MIGLEFFKDHFVLLNSRILDQKKKKKGVEIRIENIHFFL